ncbi:MAG: alpha/beta fold hydrolase [Bacteroidota bacterium]
MQSNFFRNYIPYVLLFGLVGGLMPPQPAQAQAPSGLDTLSLKTIFMEPYLPGKRPSLRSFTPDGKGVYFAWNDSSYASSELFKVKFRRPDVTPVDSAHYADFEPSPDGKHIAYIFDSDLWVADADYSDARRVIAAKSREYSLAWSDDSQQLAFSLEGDVWIYRIDGMPTLKQITQKREDEVSYSVSEWASSKELILTQYDQRNERTVYFPEYLGKLVEPGERESGRGHSRISVANLDSNTVRTLIDQTGWLRNLDSSENGRYVAVDFLEASMKHRWITVFDLHEHNSTVVFEDSTDGWISYGSADARFAPEASTLLLTSERDGWNHVYTVQPDGSDLQQHTRGQYEVPWVRWLDDDEIVFASTQVDPGERHIYRKKLGDKSAKQLTKAEGYRKGFNLGPDRRYLVYEKTYFNEPFELYSLDLKRNREEQRLTHTIPDRFRKIDWQKEEYIRFTGRDGKTELSMSLLKPVDFNPDQKYPAVVFVHGAGSLQNVYKGWSNSYWREYMFHQYLTKQGYAVIEVDYRHSTGYGRKFREDVTNWMGKYETQDIIDGIDYVAQRGLIDTSRVGIYGGSYGGFMALYASSVAPERFDAAAALRAVTNWENYYYANQWYTLPRLGHPEKDSEHYDRSSPITYADSMEVPVLMLHGLVDNNVGFQDAAQYIERLIQSGNTNFEMMMYPSERHSFQDPDAWYDEYRRIYDFFERHLK